MSGKRAKQLRRIGGNGMKQQGSIPMAVPAIGGQQQQPFDVREAVRKNCEKCGGENFNPVVKIAIVSSIAPGNKTGKDVLIQVPVFVCMSCGCEFGKKDE